MLTKQNISMSKPNREGEKNTYRTTAKIVGAMYLAGFVVGITGIVLIQSILGAPDHLATLSASSMLLAIAAVLWLMAAAWDAAHGVLMFPVLKQLNSERIAVGYLGFRIMDGLIIAIMVLFILIQIPIGSEYLNAGASEASYLQALSNVFVQAQLDAYNIAMTTLGISGLILCYAFYKSKLVPRLLSVWGLVGYATILCGSVLEVLGFNLLSIHAIPGGLWEMFIGVWLIVKGFNPSAFASESTNPDDGVLTGVDQPAVVVPSNGHIPSNGRVPSKG
ncbi:MAG TPA: DUF4386 domain-containing protein [Rubrobacteraceae bacterium]|nr:DUF4386 domain-containing protein [Rubrobacteraceae bacterium]